MDVRKRLVSAVRREAGTQQDRPAPVRAPRRRRTALLGAGPAVTTVRELMTELSDARAQAH